MGERRHNRSPHTVLNRRRTDERPPEQPSITDEWLKDERSTTDESLREERSATDTLLDPRHDEQRVDEVVRDVRTVAETALRGVRAESDVQLEKQAAALPDMSEKLELVAETLSKAAVPGTVTVQLAEITEGIADITSNLSEERRDADEVLREEREATDRLVVQELKKVEANLAQELRKERQALRQERQATDENLANERRQTDEAVEHVQGLLVEERRHHAHAARGVSTRNEFLAIVSHDLRGPLMTIAGVAALMEQQAPADERGQRMHAWADRVRRSVSVMERLISDLLDFNSFEDGQLRVAAERLDIRAVIHGEVDASHGVAMAKGLSLEADLPAAPLMTKYDPHRISQVLSNLIHNAIKFTARGGSVRVSAARAGTFCLVSVSDTGIGIPEGELTGIFERFRQLNPSDRTGLGLGLYISKWIVEAHGGRIWAESTVGLGTTVHFTLPEERRSS